MIIYEKLIKRIMEKYKVDYSTAIEIFNDVD